VGPRAGRKVFTLQSLPPGDEGFSAAPGKVGGFSVHAGVAARADERGKLERLCRTISRPVLSQERLSLTPGGLVRYPLKTPYCDGTPHVLFEPLDFIARLAALAAQTTRESHPLPRRVCPEQRAPRAGDQGPSAARVQQARQRPRQTTEPRPSAALR